MAINMAQKRFKKAQKRKQQVAAKRRIEAVEGTLAARVRKAAQAPIASCILTESLFEGGMGTLVLARGYGHYAVASFLLDSYCLGVKDVMFRSMDADCLDFMVEATSAASPSVDVDPSYARKLLRELVTWAQSLGIAPHADFAAVEALFGDVDANASAATFEFGRNGRPVYIPGPTDTPQLMRRRILQLTTSVGPEGFDTEEAA